MFMGEVPFKSINGDAFAEHSARQEMRPPLKEISQTMPALAAILEAGWKSQADERLSSTDMLEMLKEIKRRDDKKQNSFLRRAYRSSWIHGYIHAYIHTYIHVYIHTYIDTYVHTCMHACMQA